MEEFLKTAGKLGLLKAVPESFVPDNAKIHEYFKRTESVPSGCQLIPPFRMNKTMEQTVPKNGTRPAKLELQLAYPRTPGHFFMTMCKGTR